MPRRPRRYTREYRRYRFNRARFIRRQNRQARATPVRYRSIRRRSRRKLPIGGFPAQRTTVLRYVEDFSLDPGNGTVAVNVFSVNSLYDPNYTGTGHQPMFFDNYSQLYAKYKVNYATITFVALDNHIVNTTVGNQTDGNTLSQTQVFASSERAARMFILADGNPADVPSDLDNLIEEGNPRLRWKFAPQNTSSGMHKIKMKIWPHKQLNVSYRDDKLSASTSANPDNQVYFICGVDSMPNKNADTMRYQVIITYNVTFFDFIGNQTQN